MSSSFEKAYPTKFKVASWNSKIQFEFFESKGVKNIKWVGPFTGGVSCGHVVYWSPRVRFGKRDDTLPSFTANSMACLLDECNILGSAEASIRLDDITLDIYKELQDVRLYVTDLKTKLLCSKMST